MFVRFLMLVVISFCTAMIRMRSLFVKWLFGGMRCFFACDDGWTKPGLSSGFQDKNRIPARSIKSSIFAEATRSVSPSTLRPRRSQYLTWLSFTRAMCFSSFTLSPGVNKGPRSVAQVPCAPDIMHRQGNPTYCLGSELSEPPSREFLKAPSKSIGTGKIKVEFFSAETSTIV